MPILDTVALYVRLSVEDRSKFNDTDDSESIQNQKTLLMKYALDSSWAVYKIYSDEDYSGLDKDRPEFNRLLEDAEQGRFNIVLCKSQARFTRDMEHVEKYLHNKFLEWGVRFVSITDNADTAEKGNKKSRQINGLVNEWYCEDISEAVKASFKIKREAGKFIGSFAAYGYDKSSEDKNALVVDEEAAGVVRIIYDWYLEGHGTQHIASMLNNLGILNPTQYKSARGMKFKNPSQKNAHGLWNKTTVKRILKNEIYIGNMVQGIRRKTSYKSKKVRNTPEGEWIVVKGTHCPIIDYNTFAAVQKRINGNVRECKEGKAHLFAAKVRCLDCGSSMCKVTAAGHTYLRCRLYKTAPGKRLCSSHSIRLDSLASTVYCELKGYMSMMGDSDALARRLQMESDVSMRLRQLQLKQDRLTYLINESGTIVKNLYIDKLKGLITEGQFRGLNNTYICEKQKQEEQLAVVKDKMEEVRKKLDGIDKWIGVIEKHRNFSELTRHMVNELINYIEIGEKEDASGKREMVIHWLF